MLGRLWRGFGRGSNRTGSRPSKTMKTIMRARPRPHGPSCLSAVILISGSVCLLPPQALAQDSTRISVNREGDRITIAASKITRGDLLEALRTKYGIEVRPFDAASDLVTVNVVNLPIDSAIATIMPIGSHYIVRLGERDVTRVASVPGEKKGVTERRDAALTPKRETPLRRPEGDRFKPDPRRVRERSPVEGRGLKPLPEASQRVPPGRGPKIARSTRPTADSTLRISFVIRAPDSIRPVRATVIEGGGADSSIVRGPFLFALRDAAGTLIFFGSLIDPLEEHSYVERTGQHDQGRVREGIFAISLPARLAGRLGATRLEFYDARNVSLPPTLDARAFERAASQAKAFARVDGRVLLATLREGPR
jgi:hypothetical protein